MRLSYITTVSVPYFKCANAIHNRQHTRHFNIMGERNVVGKGDVHKQSQLWIKNQRGDILSTTKLISDTFLKRRLIFYRTNLDTLHEYRKIDCVSGLIYINETSQKMTIWSCGLTVYTL